MGLMWNETVSSNIWTRVTDSISYDDNHYAKHVFLKFMYMYIQGITQ